MANKAWQYTYDLGGNILTRTEYDYVNGEVTGTGSTISYTYGDSGWKDKLTAYNGQTISCDAIGNPLSYRGMTMSWQGGRQLAALTRGSKNLSFAYNESGLRTSKTVNGAEHRYYWTNGKLSAEICDAYSLFFHYDANGDILGYTYKTNGGKAAEYIYDAWGRVLSATGTMANINPIRYRGYYYDTETGLYYLQSRYYDPEVGRFINADDVANLGAEGEINSLNLFIYCLNNPVNRTDGSGNWSLHNWAKVAIGVVATVTAVAVTVATGGAALPVIAGVTVSTAISGVVGYATGGKEGMKDGLASGFMMSGLSALGGSVICGAVRTIRNAKAGITIGKMGQFDDVAKLANTRYYSGLKEFGLIKKVAGKKAAEAVGWWQNKNVVKGVMALKGAIYDCGGELTGAYAKEVALTKGYEYLYNVWLM